MKLKDNVAIITGASKGIGKGIAERYSREGAKVVLASRSMDRLSAISDEINRKGGRSLALTVDVRQSESVQTMIDRVVSELGRVDIMVNNAGVSMAHPSETLSPSDWTRAIETDLSGVFFGCQSAGRQMMLQGGGCIINITSMYGLVAAPMRAAYCASKAAGNMLTKVLASEWAAKRIRVNAIAPVMCALNWSWTFSIKGSCRSMPSKTNAPGANGEVEDVLGAAVFLASDEAAYITGSIMTVDGGWTAYGYL